MNAIHESGYICSDEGKVYHPVKGNEVGSKFKHNQRVYVCLWDKVKKKNVRHFRYKMIWEAFNGPVPKGMDIDHINAIPFDDRLENLRLLTHARNVMAGRNHHSGTSKYRGVCADRGKWRTSIKFEGKVITCGFFMDEIEAAKARDEHAFRAGYPLEGLNFPETYKNMERPIMPQIIKSTYKTKKPCNQSVQPSRFAS
jgi:hypothetical protein